MSSAIYLYLDCKNIFVLKYHIKQADASVDNYDIGANLEDCAYRSTPQHSNSIVITIAWANHLAY